MPSLAELPPEMPKSFMDKLKETTLANIAKSVWGAVTLPGDVYQGNVSMYGADGRTNPEVINRSADLAGSVTLGAGAVPAGANELRAGIRPYQNVPENLMGYRKSGPQKAFTEQAYKHEQPVKVVFPNGEVFEDTVRGLNADHALERAYRNWPDAIHIGTK